MSACENMEALISAMLDGELSESETAAVREHIAECDDCRALYQAFTELGAVMAAEEPIPEQLHTNIMSTICAADKAMHVQKRLVRLRTCLALAACLIVVVGTVLSLRTVLLHPKNDMKAESIEVAAAGADSAGDAMYDREISNALPPAAAAPAEELEEALMRDDGGEGAARWLTIKVTEAAEGRIVGTVVASDAFAVGQEITVISETLDTEIGAVLEVEFDRVEGDVVYALG